MGSGMMIISSSWAEEAAAVGFWSATAGLAGEKRDFLFAKAPRIKEYYRKQQDKIFELEAPAFLLNRHQ